MEFRHGETSGGGFQGQSSPLFHNVFLRGQRRKARFVALRRTRHAQEMHARVPSPWCSGCGRSWCVGLVNREGVVQCGDFVLKLRDHFIELA